MDAQLGLIYCLLTACISSHSTAATQSGAARQGMRSTSRDMGFARRADRRGKVVRADKIVNFRAKSPQFVGRRSVDRLVVKGAAEPYIPAGALEETVSSDDKIFPAVGDITRIPRQFAEDVAIGQIKSLRFDTSRRKWIAQVEDLTEYADGFFDIGRDSKWTYYDVDQLAPVCAFFVKAKGSWKVMYKSKNDATQSSTELLQITSGYDLPVEPGFMPDVLTKREDLEEDVSRFEDMNRKFTEFLNEIITFKLPLVLETFFYAALGAAVWNEQKGEVASELYLLGVAAGIAYVILLNDTGGPARVAIPALLIASIAKKNAALQGITNWLGTEKTFSLIPKEQFLAAITGFATHRLPLLRKGATEAISMLSELSKPSVEPSPRLVPITSAPRLETSNLQQIRRKETGVSQSSDFESSREASPVQMAIGVGRKNDAARRKAATARAAGSPPPGAPVVTAPMSLEKSLENSKDLETEAPGDEETIEIPPPVDIVYVSAPPGVDTQKVVEDIVAFNPRLRQPVWLTDTPPLSTETRKVKVINPDEFSALSESGSLVFESKDNYAFGLGSHRFGLTYQDIIDAAEGGFGVCVQSPVLTDNLPEPPEEAGDNPSPLRGIGVVVLPKSQIVQERVIKDNMEELLKLAEYSRVAPIFSDSIDRRVAVRGVSDEKIRQTDAWITAAARSSEYHYAIAEYPDYDKGLAGCVEFISKVGGYSASTASTPGAGLFN